MHHRLYDGNRHPQMLAWEWEHQVYEVHHLLVLAYHLQHPSLYSRECLPDAQRMLVAFVEDRVTPQAMRKRISCVADSGVRDDRITGTRESHGRYEQPIAWTMVAGDVVRAGVDGYDASVQAWAASILRSLRESGTLT